MAHITGHSREQLTLFPETLDDYIAADNPVRFLDAFVETVDLEALGFQHAVPSKTGRPPYHPADLLRLYIYGYLNRIRSSRLLEREAGRNLELMWLLRRLTPDFKTIAGYRKNNPQAIRQVCREFVLFCRELDLFGGKLIAIDGSKFKAVNARDRNFSARKLESLVQELDTRLKEELDTNDAQALSVRQPTVEELQRKIKLILDHEVTNAPTDQGQLSTMAVRAKALLGVEQLEVVADMGYYDGQEI